MCAAGGAPARGVSERARGAVFRGGGLAPGGTPAPARAGTRLGVPPACGGVGDLDGVSLPDTLWVGQFRDTPPNQGRPNRVVGVTTASGANSVVQISSASPIPLAALAIDAHNDGGNQIIVSDGRGARLYTFAQCQLQAVVDSQGTPFVFDLHLRGHGTRVGCSDLGRTETDLYGTLATIGQSDTVTAAYVQDPAAVSAQTITCGDLTISKDGVRQP